VNFLNIGQLIFENERGPDGATKHFGGMEASQRFAGGVETPNDSILVEHYHEKPGNFDQCFKQIDVTTVAELRIL
jgi:hypothetical protein